MKFSYAAVRPFFLTRSSSFLLTFHFSESDGCGILIYISALLRLKTPAVTRLASSIIVYTVAIEAVLQGFTVDADTGGRMSA
jgi:hypothetical protein